MYDSSGFPMPSYSWRREGSSKAGAKSHANASLVLSSSNTLLLGAAARRHAGRYLCAAHNRHGAVQAAALLDVMCTRALSDTVCDFVIYKIHLLIYIYIYFQLYLNVE